MTRTPQPSDLELQVLSVLWQRGPMTARQVLDSMPDGKPRAYTTILSVMQVMERKGLVTHDTAGNTHVYRPTSSKAKTLGPILRRLVKHVFGGDSAAAVQQLLRETDVNPEAVAEIRGMLDALTARNTPKGKEKENP